MSILDPRIWLAAILALAAAFGLGYWRGDAAATRHERNACLTSTRPATGRPWAVFSSQRITS